ncbi:MAG: cation:proton antiporter [Gemmatimonadales bacterium]
MPDILLLLAQIAGITVVARLVGRGIALLGQPYVVGEMLAGILLGPSFLGWIAPDVWRALFPVASLGFLSALSQIGLVFYMFLVGLELDVRHLRGRQHAAVITSHASIIAPFFLGVCVALLLYPRVSDDSVSFTAFALFMGAAMSVTAFPVLARMLAERGLLRTRLGTVAIACAAVDDVSAWCLLAAVAVVARAGASTMSLPMMFGGAVLYATLMLTVVRWGLGRLRHVVERRGELSQDVVAFVVFFILASALVTERLGIHAVFGAFLAGVVMPRDTRFSGALLDRFHDLMVILFLPLFFAFTGLRTSIQLIEGNLWVLAILVLLVAVAGKVGGSALAARASGLTWRESWAIGTLMNTRGLMELVILNVGLDLGVVSPALFAMMVVMALVTTFMTTPLLERIYPTHLVHSTEAAEAAEAAEAEVPA